MELFLLFMSQSKMLESFPSCPGSICLLCTLLGLTLCPSGLQKRRRLFLSKSAQQGGQDMVTRGVLVLQAGNKPCCSSQAS